VQYNRREDLVIGTGLGILDYPRKKGKKNRRSLDLLLSKNGPFSVHCLLVKTLPEV